MSIPTATEGVKVAGPVGLGSRIANIARMEETLVRDLQYLLNPVLCCLMTEMVEIREQSPRVGDKSRVLQALYTSVIKASNRRCSGST